MRKIAPVILLALACAGYSQFAAARGPGGGAGGPGGAGGAPHFGGPASGSQAAVNSNGRFASDRDTGLDRAEDRMSAQGKAHEKATDAAGKRHRKHP